MPICTAVFNVIVLNHTYFTGLRSTEMPHFKHAELINLHKNINHLPGFGVSHSFILPSLEGPAIL